MKNKTTYTLYFVTFLTVTIFALFSYKKETRFSNYVATKTVNPQINIGKIEMGKAVNISFKIKNLNEGYYVISKIIKDNRNDIIQAPEMKLIDTSKVAIIKLSFLPQKKGNLNKKISVISNSKSGTIDLNVSGIVE